MKGYDSAHRLWRLYCTSSAWEGAAARILADVHFEDLRIAARHAEPNVRLFSIRLMITLGDLRAIRVLRSLLADDSSNVPSACQTDEDEPVQTVANAASEAICRLQNMSRDTRVRLSGTEP